MSLAANGGRAGTGKPPIASEGSEADILGSLPRLGKMSTQLQQTSAQIEESVLAVCTSFQGIAERARATVDKTVSFLGRDGAKSSGQPSFEQLIETCGSTLVNIMNTIDEAGAVSQRAIERIQQMDRASQQIGIALRQLDQIASGNKILALNARIEAAHSGSFGVGFSAVAVELAAQTEKSQDVTAKVGDLADDLRALAASTLEDLERMHEKDHERVEDCRKKVNESLYELRSAHFQMEEALNGMTEDGALLANDIGAAIRGLQFQDRVAQRIAHVVEDLECMKARLEGPPPAGGEFEGMRADDGFSAYTMREERAVDGGGEIEAPAGDVELF